LPILYGISAFLQEIESEDLDYRSYKGDENMKKFLLFLLSIAFVFSMIGIAGATSYSFQPSDKDLGDLAHGKYYTWGINMSIPEGEHITGASLFFDNIRNWDNNPNDLYGHLLDSATVGVDVRRDNRPRNQFTGQGVALFHWEDLPGTAQDLTYDFSASDISFLGSYVSNDGNFGFGFDPDCHFYNDGVTLAIETAPVPEPTTMLLFGAGLVGLAGFGRKKFKK
jgi:hypothetical protein